MKKIKKSVGFSPLPRPAVPAEVTAPVGSYESLQAAIQAGADSIYFGIDKLNMRSHSANNFKLKDLKKISEICKKNNLKCYLTLNTIIYNKELKQIKQICDKAKQAKIDAIIASDFSVIQYANKIKLPVHVSTQVNISNIEEVKFFSKYADVIVLARELNLTQIKQITSQIKKQKITGPSKRLIKIEIFIHGALCISLSGKCYMSLANYNTSANRGKCFQSCRRKYKVYDDETEQELTIDNKFVMSPSDLCTIGSLDKILASGINILKIEGRARKADYVYQVVKAYKEAIDSIQNKTYTKSKINNWLKELKKVYNRGFWKGGYYLGKKAGEWSGQYGSHSTQKKIYLGICTHYFDKKQVGCFKIETGELKQGDNILITGTKTGVLYQKANNLLLDNKKILKAKKGDLITFKTKKRIRKGDKLYILASSQSH